MRGPFERLKYDFRRTWECPVCHHREWTGGDVTSRLCACQRKLEPPERVWMRLIHDGPRRTDGVKPEARPPEPQPDTPPATETDEGGLEVGG
jgi:hypothetical protein